MSKSKNKQILVCPNCGSTNLKGSHTMSPQERVFFNVQNKMLTYSQDNINFYGCGDCGYYGIAPKIDVNNLDDFRLQVKERKNFSSPGINKNKISVRIISISILVAFIVSFSALFFESYFLPFVGTGIALLGIIVGTIIYYKNKKHNP